MTPFSFMALNLQMTSLICEAQTVATLRVLGMSGAIPAIKGENDRMIAEKPAAIVDAYAAGAKAAMAGENPDRILSAAMAPFERKVKANRKRLMK